MIMETISELSIFFPPFSLQHMRRCRLARAMGLALATTTLLLLPPPAHSSCLSPPFTAPSLVRAWVCLRWDHRVCGLHACCFTPPRTASRFPLATLALMLRQSGASRIAFPINRDTSKTPRIIKEVGQWHYRKETVEEFQNWCKLRQVRGYGNFRITSSMQFARCLRASKRLHPGQGIITVPFHSCLNFLVVAREMYDTPNNMPVQLNWMNYDQRLPYLPGASHAELAQAAWMCRIHSLEESPLTPYVKWLLEDSRGRDGIANGISKERGEESGMVDHIFSEIATDSCEDPEVFLENLFKSFAALHLRSIPIEPEPIRWYIDGTSFFKARADDMHVPTLMPLIDAVPQLEDGHHNTVVEYFQFTDETTLRAQVRELELPDLIDPRVVEKGGFFALRAMIPIEEGDFLYLRGFPKIGGTGQESLTNQMLEANALLNND